jgi:hypothetical protein
MNSEVGIRNAENKKRCKAPTVVTLGRDYGSAGRAQGPRYKNKTFNLIQFHIPHSQFRIQIHLSSEPLNREPRTFEPIL